MKSAQRDPGGKRQICYHCGKEGHLKWDGHQASKLPPGSDQTEKHQTEKHQAEKQGETALRGTGPRVELSGKSGQKMPGGPHTSSHPNYT